MMALGWSALFLGEKVSWPFFLTAAVVLVSMAVCIGSRIPMAEAKARFQCARRASFRTPCEPG